MEFPNIHIVWTEGDILSFPDLLSRAFTTTTQDDHSLRTVEIHESTKFFMKHSQQTSPIQCHYVVSKEYINTVTTNTTIKSSHFSIYLQIKNNYFKVQVESNLFQRVSYQE